METGVFPGRPSFSEGGMPPPPAKWKGKCEFNVQLVTAKEQCTEI